MSIFFPCLRHAWLCDGSIMCMLSYCVGYKVIIVGSCGNVRRCCVVMSSYHR
ncbi:hypothetical protein [Anaplasma phagocytophilum]|uniref:hypothetical protein n=1 Tax=Anaplasma phagocytophilum TaxID=948 RepID=UPI000A7DA2B2|nr:hypothetical protein [Anaplasma phagocytophilum]